MGINKAKRPFIFRHGRKPESHKRNTISECIYYITAELKKQAHYVGILSIPSQTPYNRLLPSQSLSEATPSRAAMVGAMSHIFAFGSSAPGRFSKAFNQPAHLIQRLGTGMIILITHPPMRMSNLVRTSQIYKCKIRLFAGNIRKSAFCDHLICSLIPADASGHIKTAGKRGWPAQIPQLLPVIEKGASSAGSAQLLAQAPDRPAYRHISIRNGNGYQLFPGTSGSSSLQNTKVTKSPDPKRSGDTLLLPDILFGFL